MAAMKRFASRSLLASASALALFAASAEAANAPVAVGDYEGAPVVETGQTYQIAGFAVTKEAGRRTIVASTEYGAIFYPDVGKCDQLTLPLSAETIAVSATGRFKIKEVTPVEETKVTVNWKGRWTKAKRVAGTITIKSGGCTSTERWVGRRVR